LKSSVSNSTTTVARAPEPPYESSPPQRDPATVTIANIGDQDFYISRTYGIFHIPASAKGEPYSLLLITARGDALDLGDNRRFPFTISAREIAEDLIQNLVVHGVFVCAGARPTESEVAAASARRQSWYQDLVSEADAMWARGHSYREISDMHRRAALSLGIERDWAFVPHQLMDCPACGEKVKPHVALCKHCGAVLDEEKAAKHNVGGRKARQTE
jgi:ribosomal protein L32